MLFRKPKKVRINPSVSLDKIQITMVDLKSVLDLKFTLALSDSYDGCHHHNNSILVDPGYVETVLSVMSKASLFQACESIDVPMTCGAYTFWWENVYGIMMACKIKRSDLMASQHYILIPHAYGDTLDDAESEVVAVGKFVHRHIWYVLISSLEEIDITKFELSKHPNSSLRAIYAPPDVSTESIKCIPEKIRDQFYIQQMP